MAKERRRLANKIDRKLLRIGVGLGFNSIENRRGAEDVRLDGIYLPVVD